MKTIKPNEKHQAFHNDAVELLRKHGEALPAVEILALCSQLVGQVLALQDQRTMTPAMGMELIAVNIEMGNKGAIEDLLGDVKGHG